jgi:hypothetical protein
VADEPEPDRICLDFRKWTNFASNIEKFQHDATGGRSREPYEDTRRHVARTHIAAPRLHHWLGRASPGSPQLIASVPSSDYSPAGRGNGIVIDQGGIRPFEPQVAAGQARANRIIISVDVNEL